MKLAQTTYDNSETGCCARVDKTKWNDREFVWKEKPFLRDHMRAIFHMPLNFGSVMARDQAAIEKAAAWPEEPFWLTDEVSPWGSDLYVAVDGDVPDARIERMSGTFHTYVFEGPYRDVGKWITATESSLKREGKSAEKLYFYYATCPNCAKKFGANQVVVFAQVA
jgi:hypothetical protein